MLASTMFLTVTNLDKVGGEVGGGLAKVGLRVGLDDVGGEVGGGVGTREGLGVGLAVYDKVEEGETYLTRTKAMTPTRARQTMRGTQQRPMTNKAHLRDWERLVLLGVC